MNWLRQWFARHFIMQGEVDAEIRRMVVEAREVVDHNMPSSRSMDPGPSGTSDHPPIPATRYYLPPDPKE